MRFCLVLVLLSNIILVADWESNVGDIKTNTDDMSTTLDDIYLSLNSLKSTVQGRSSWSSNDIYDVTDGGSLGVGLPAVGTVDDGTWYDPTSKFARIFTVNGRGLTDKTFFDENSDGYWVMSRWKQADFVDTMFGYSQSNVTSVGQILGNNHQSDAPDPADESQAMRVANNVTTQFRARFGSDWAIVGDTYLFRLDLSGLDSLLHTNGVFSDWVFDVTLVPDQVESPYLYTIWTKWQEIRSSYYIDVIIKWTFLVFYMFLIYCKFLNFVNSD